MRTRAAKHLLLIPCLGTVASARGVTFALYRYDDCEQDRASWIFKPNATQLGRAGACVKQETLNELGLLPSTIRSIQLVELDPACTVTVYTGICNGDGANALRLDQCMSFSGLAFSSLSIDGGNCNLPEGVEAGPFGSSVSALSTTVITGAPSTTETTRVKFDTALTAPNSVTSTSVVPEQISQTVPHPFSDTTSQSLAETVPATTAVTTGKTGGHSALEPVSPDLIVGCVVGARLICSLIGGGYVLYKRRRRKQQLSLTTQYDLKEWPINATSDGSGVQTSSYERNTAMDRSQQPNGHITNNNYYYEMRRNSNKALIDAGSSKNMD